MIVNESSSNVSMFAYFANEYKEFRKILLDYKNSSKVFEGIIFLPNNCETDIKKVLKDNKVDMTNKSIEWKRIDDVYQAPLFNINKINPNFVNQGYIGDCYFMTALSQISKKGHFYLSLLSLIK